MPYNKTKLPKKLLAIALCALLMLALFPVTALAAPVGPAEITFYIGQYGRYSYESGSGGTILPGGVVPNDIGFSTGNAGECIIEGTAWRGTVGSYDITLLNNDGFLDVTINVAKGPVTIVQNDITVSAADIGNTVQLTQTARNGNGAEILSGSQDAPTLTYSGGNPNVATVDANGLVTIQGVGTTTVTIDSDVTDSYTAAQKVVTINVEGPPAITGPTSMELTEGYAAASTGAYTITGWPAAVVTPSGDISHIIWDDTNKTLDIAPGLTKGTYTVTLTASNGILPDAMYTFELTVIEPAVNNVSVSPKTATVQKGRTQPFTAAVIAQGGASTDVTWSVDSTLSTIDSAGWLSVSPDETAATLTVTATSTFDNNKFDTAKVTVTDAPPQDTVYPFTANFGTYTGQSEGLTGIIDANISAFTGLEVNGQTLHGSNYTTNAGSTIITLHSNYLDTLANGTYTVRALFTHGYAEGSFIVNKQGNAVSVTGVTLDKSTAALTVGKTVQLTATVSPDNATNTSVTWASSDTSIATVDANGKVKGVKSGTATITVTTDDGGYTATCKVTVTNAADSPQTGDSGNMMLWIITGLSSILISLYLLVWRKRQQLKENA